MRMNTGTPSDTQPNHDAFVKLDQIFSYGLTTYADKYISIEILFDETIEAIKRNPDNEEITKLPEKLLTYIKQKNLCLLTHRDTIIALLYVITALPRESIISTTLNCLKSIKDLIASGLGAVQEHAKEKITIFKKKIAALNDDDTLVSNNRSPLKGLFYEEENLDSELIEIIKAQVKEAIIASLYHAIDTFAEENNCLANALIKLKDTLHQHQLIDIQSSITDTRAFVAAELKKFNDPKSKVHILDALLQTCATIRNNPVIFDRIIRSAQSFQLPIGQLIQNLLSNERIKTQLKTQIQPLIEQTLQYKRSQNISIANNPLLLAASASNTNHLLNIAFNGSDNLLKWICTELDSQAIKDTLRQPNAILRIGQYYLDEASCIIDKIIQCAIVQSPDAYRLAAQKINSMPAETKYVSTIFPQAQQLSWHGLFAIAVYLKRINIDALVKYCTQEALESHITTSRNTKYNLKIEAHHSALFFIKAIRKVVANIDQSIISADDKFNQSEAASIIAKLIANTLFTPSGKTNTNRRHTPEQDLGRQAIKRLIQHPKAVLWLLSITQCILTTIILVLPKKPNASIQRKVSYKQSWQSAFEASILFIYTIPIAIGLLLDLGRYTQRKHGTTKPLIVLLASMCLSYYTWRTTLNVIIPMAKLSIVLIIPAITLAYLYLPKYLQSLLEVNAEARRTPEKAKSINKQITNTTPNILIQDMELSKSATCTVHII